ncbi:ABC transporter permease [Bradyrhizobium sp. U87765 SZCCT0131]|uniref:ABC transporter permease n=1 Tax=unclassified Bradyrhizobium TaxID=2631580 RepID=UPI001BA91B8F|nr:MULTISPECIES: ABC transporter permease [unclassified Bradyrhizobium]MBR1222998.1 ABC transporter permease [Bradyrhizobium sp. U87765 SZCCT0131]MBR1262734.1 ABC transporter permease [Bradyrhizobium sp. U87765 SZCCT0134]MBR1308794.1 ABC transporter permease [Bradyrhizobium sp. U87765 SZCCT0110]MBR1318516.1 ABC transporter permease [Bradyrhizobium sp. U87765 SZCCT0109]MBR1352220.1 ABC transporter permease [Bradyrhizobium sp. U87765 SZCCT0048]
MTVLDPVADGRASAVEPVRHAGHRTRGTAVTTHVLITRRRLAGERLPRPLRRLIGPLAVFLLWQLASITGLLPREILAGPAAVAASAGQLLATGELQQAVLTSLGRAVCGLAIGGSVAIALAVVAGLFRLGEDLVDSTVQMLRTLPIVALIPLLIIWFGIGEAPKVALIALATGFPLYLNVYAGIRNVDQKLIEVGQTLGLSRTGLVWNIVLPGALPNALVGLRHALGVAWLALIFGEQINANAGLGYLMNTARELFQTDVIVVCLVVYALLGLVVDAVVRLLERGLLSWRPTFTGA